VLAVGVGDDFDIDADALVRDNRGFARPAVSK